MNRPILLALAVLSSLQAAPFSLHPENPHYFLFRDKPTIIITSGEHYGAVVNLDFDYVKYLDELHSKELNCTRTWSGAYVEPQGAFNIARNSLAPGPGKFIAPWARSSTGGYPNGGNKFDLTKWDEAYFKRLVDFVKQADQRGVVVEMNLFCPFYDEAQWNLSPLKAANNVNHLGDIARTNVYTLDRNGGLLAVQDAMVRKIVTELNSFENVYFEICNEPYFGGVTIDWQGHIADTIIATENKLPNKHLISRNVANNSSRVENPHPGISIFNFHYASPPDTVGMNYGLNKVIGDNETGFRGTNDFAYRSEAWAFILAGGGLYNNLDYSFVAGHEDGTFVYPSSQPGGGNSQFRREMQTLKHFMDGFDFVHMKPGKDLIQGKLPTGVRPYVLEEPGKAWAIYLHWAGKDKPKAQKFPVELSLPPGSFKIERTDPTTGKIERSQIAASVGKSLSLPAVEFEEDMGISIIRSE